MRLSNLTTFLYRVLCAAPDLAGLRPKLARASLESAAAGFLAHVVPVDAALHDGVLKLLVSLKCQVRPLPLPFPPGPERLTFPTR